MRAANSSLTVLILLPDNSSTTLHVWRWSQVKWIDSKVGSFIVHLIILYSKYKGNNMQYMFDIMATTITKSAY